jgi:hypothetical protein
MGSDRDDKSFDVLDFIINLLKEHEQTLDNLAERLESIAEREALEPLYKPPMGGIGVSVVLRRWDEFQRRCTDAELFSFLIDNESLKVTALASGTLNVYSEKLPVVETLYRTEGGKFRFEAMEAEEVDHVVKTLKGTLDCGVELATNVIEVLSKDGSPTRIVSYSVDPQDVREWLCREMGVDPSSVVEGELRLD